MDLGLLSLQSARNSHGVCANHPAVLFLDIFRSSDMREKFLGSGKHSHHSLGSAFQVSKNFSSRNNHLPLLALNTNVSQDWMKSSVAQNIFCISWIYFGICIVSVHRTMFKLGSRICPQSTVHLKAALSSSVYMHNTYVGSSERRRPLSKPSTPQFRQHRAPYPCACNRICRLFVEPVSTKTDRQCAQSAAAFGTILRSISRSPTS